MKKHIALCLAIIMLIGYVPFIAQAAEAENPGTIFASWAYPTHLTQDELNSLRQANWPATYNTLTTPSALQFFYANGAQGVLGRNQGDRSEINVPNNAGRWFPEGEIHANNAAGWHVTFSTLGFENITFSAMQGSSNNGPSDFGLAYRLGTTGAWTSFARGPRTTALSDDGLPLGETFSNMPLPETTFDQAVVQVKVYIASNMRRSDGANTLDPVGGNTSINNIVLRHFTEAQEPPEIIEPEPQDNTVFEVAFMLDASIILDEEGNFLPYYRNLLLGGAGSANTNGQPGRERRLYMQWMDTPDQVFSAQGWINRIRHRHWQNLPFQLTYRNRVPIAWPVTEESLAAAFAQAYAGGFVGNGWELEVDWSYDSAVLTASYSHTSLTYDQVNDFSCRFGILPSVERSRELLLENIPVHAIYAVGGQALVEWYIANLPYVVEHGPVYYRRYDNRSPLNLPASFGNIGLTIEVMPIRNADNTGIEYIVEASFDGIGLASTAEKRDAVQGILEDLGILLPESGLRTSTVLARYRRPAPEVPEEPEIPEEPETPEEPERPSAPEAPVAPPATTETWERPLMPLVPRTDRTPQLPGNQLPSSQNQVVTPDATSDDTPPALAPIGSLTALLLASQPNVAPVSLRLTIGQNAFTRNGVTQVLEVAPFIQEDRVMVPLRFVAEALGVDVNWVSETRTVQILAPTATIHMAVDTPLPNNMGTPVILEGRTFVPLGYIAEVLGAEATWDSATQSVEINR